MRYRKKNLPARKKVARGDAVFARPRALKLMKDWSSYQAGNVPEENEVNYAGDRIIQSMKGASGTGTAMIRLARNANERRRKENNRERDDERTPRPQNEGQEASLGRKETRNRPPEREDRETADGTETRNLFTGRKDRRLAAAGTCRGGTAEQRREENGNPPGEQSSRRNKIKQRTPGREQPAKAFASGSRNGRSTRKKPMPFKGKEERTPNPNYGRENRSPRIRISMGKRNRNPLRKRIPISARPSGTLLLSAAFLVLGLVVLLGITGMLLSSPLGLFFSGNTAEEDMSVRDAVRTINHEFQTKLEELTAGSEAEQKEIDGERASWEEVLAVYAVLLTTAGTEPAQEVVTMNEEKLERLRSVFWDMHTVESGEEVRTEEKEQEIVLKSGKTIRETISVDTLCLHVAIHHKSPEEMAEIYGFTPGQEKMLGELQEEQYRPLWREILYGIGTGDDLAEVALTQVGQIGGQPYWEWYGYSGRVEWCACFVSWCANECGYIEEGTIPKFDNCQVGAEWFRNNAVLAQREETPEKGWIIFFDWEQDGVSDHVGIVEKVEGGFVHTIEGNSGNMCKQGTYPLGSGLIYGYGVPEDSVGTP